MWSNTIGDSSSHTHNIPVWRMRLRRDSDKSEYYFLDRLLHCVMQCITKINRQLSRPTKHTFTRCLSLWWKSFSRFNIFQQKKKKHSLSTNRQHLNVNADSSFIVVDIGFENGDHCGVFNLTSDFRCSTEIKRRVDLQAIRNEHISSNK